MITPAMFRDIWRFRGFIRENVRREFHSRYVGTQFGFLWAIIQPFAMILIYTLVFAGIMKPSLPGDNRPFAYSIYLCSGLLSWGLFCELVNKAVGVFVHNANLIKKIHFPKLTLPVIIIFSACIHYGIVMTVFFCFLLTIGAFPGWVTLAAIPVVFLLIGFAVGFGILCGTINVFYRDVEQALGLALQFWFWLTPIVYANKTLPLGVIEILTWNPLYPVFRALQTIFLEHSPPEWASLLYPLIITVAFLSLGLFSFRRLNGAIVDEL